MFRSLYVTASLFLSMASGVYAQDLSAVRSGNEAFREGDYEAAIDAYSEAIQSGALDGEALAITYNNRGVAYGEVEDFDQAIADYNQALALRPDDTTTLKNLRVAHVRRGQLRAAADDDEAAVRDFNRAIEVQPDHYLAYLRRAELFEEQGELELAVIDYERASMLRPEDREIVTTLRRAQEQLDSAQAGEAVASGEVEAEEPVAALETEVEAEEVPAAEDVSLADADEDADASVAAADGGVAEPDDTGPGLVPEEATTESDPVFDDTAREVAADREPPEAEIAAGEVTAVETLDERTASAAEAEPEAAIGRSETAPSGAQEGEATELPAQETSELEAGPSDAARSPEAATQAALLEESDSPEGATAGDGGNLYRAISPVNFRAGPSNDAERLGAIDEGTVVEVTGEELGWLYALIPNGQEGYIYRRWLEPVED